MLNNDKNMKKKTMASVLIAVVIIVIIIIALVYPYVTKPKLPELPVTLPPKIEKVEIKVGETVLVKGNPVKLISIEEENNTVKIEVFNETTGEPMVVPFDFIRGGEAFKLRKGLYISPLLGPIEDDRVTFLITEDPPYSEEDMQNR